MTIIVVRQDKLLHEQKKEKPDSEATQRPSTLAALLKEKPRRGRPSHNVSRQNVYVALAKSQKNK